MDEVGGEEDVKGRAVDDLGGKGGGGAVADVELYPGLLLIELGEDGHDRLEIGSGGDQELRLRVLRVLRRGFGGREEKPPAGEQGKR